MNFTGNRPNILIVDDEEKICKLAKTFLEHESIFGQIITASSITIALMKYRHERFDLVIVDYNMPNKTGAELIELIKASAGKHKSKFMLISGYLDRTGMNEVIKLGVKDILIKPFNRVSFVSKVIEVLGIEEDI